MTILDANILLYAYNSDAPQHKAAARWLRELFAGSEPIGLPWVTLWAFVRISTNPRIWPNPKPAAEAMDLVRRWLSEPGVHLVEPGPRHLDLLGELVTGHRAAGALVTDAVLAAIAIEHGAVLASTDLDFRRFPDLRWQNPLA